MRALVERSPALDPATIDEVYLGDANQAGEDNRNVARMAVLLAGLPTTIPAATVNRLCGSGIEAIFGASRAVAVGDADIAIAGGVESMTRAPWVLPKPAKAYPTGHEQLWSTTLGWRMINPKMPDGVDRLARRGRRGAGRQVLDLARRAGRVRPRLTPARRRGVGGRILRRRDRAVAGVRARARRVHPRRHDDREAGRAEAGVPADGGTVTAGNASPMNDGAAALLVTSTRGLTRTGATPMARIVGGRPAASSRICTASGRSRPPRTALRRAGIDWGDLASVELNEAFAAQSLACLREWPELDPTIVNPHGGAIAIGHPLGASGARIVTTLAHHLRRTGGRYGLAAMCIGVGQGIAVVIENLR